MSTENCLVKAIYSFKGKNNDELCFKKGDIITVTQKEEGGWWEGTLGETTGWFPSNYVTEHKDPSGSVTTSPIRAASEIQAFRNVVLKDIIDSEKAHVAEMQGLVSNFLQPLEKSDMLTRDEFKQLTGNINEVLQVHEQFLALLDECATKTGPDQRVGGLFLQWAPKIKSVHQTYCAGHPKAVCILDKYKEELNTWMEEAGAVCPGVLVLTAGLSKPFRRLGKYPAMLQELARHVHEAHPDRGDTHRASVVYKDIASGCAALRRQKELELQVVTGEVRGWPGGELASLGDVLHMGSVAVGPSHQDRYLVLFPSALLLLSVSKRVSAFVYEGCLPLTGITVSKLDDTDTRKNAFEIGGPMIDTIVAVCQTRAEADNWVSLLQKHSNTSSPAHEPGQPQSLPHMAMSDSNNSDLSSGLTNHKRSHSFNNHQSYTQHMQQTQKNKQKNQSARWLLNSCDSLDQSPAKSNKSPIGKKFSSVDFIDTAGSNYSNKGWSITCLRPAPPLRPQSFTVGSDENIGPTHPYAPHQRKSNSYEEDALILKVIEAYCTSARCRNAVSSVDCGHLSLGKVQYHAPATNIPHYNYTKLPTVQRSNTPEYSGCSKTTKVKRNKSSSAADAYLYRGPDTRRLLSDRKFDMNRSNPNLWECSEERRQKLICGRERRSGSHPSLAAPLRAVLTVPSPSTASRSARSSTWCCGTFVKQLTKSHHFD
ncbi:rho guanine nucleotide exchange factor 7 isoform X2 [Spodoptera frugiperda]|uniref:Rho guanine nucleotide exchange factor 7 isoform X2 n=1 Tax=Spodoptera frugiperda TaxID=7108 RepID=A0A9R0DQH1_SPOFR|nr:rho guanine nucleotide exchange factor 7 isoform X2 [Spodoptera frugiperda]XP_050551027.1 rho guanine nucleotide exchange factor 7 isoform X2 [Spodoptera frugiperda]XP_050551349.1 rho guanine nucleotide exchange factor 7 isoform X2 [Spodoptera frugiperda]